MNYKNSKINIKPQKPILLDDYSEIFRPDKQRLYGKHIVPRFKKYHTKVW
ncbi:MAG TPA: hypothetical protein VLG25_02860 [Patescibacteria group bacterium]|nr:hypothetical protein [Patescibacteria group bacterium]